MTADEILSRVAEIRANERRYGPPRCRPNTPPTARRRAAELLRVAEPGKLAKPAAPKLFHARALPWAVEGLAIPCGAAGCPQGGPRGEALTMLHGALTAVPDGDCVLCVNHWWGGDAADPDEVLAATSDGSLRLWTDARGLHYRARFRASRLGNIVIAKLQRGECTGASVGFSYATANAKRYGTNLAVSRARVSEVSLLFGDRRPAYPETSAALIHCDPGLSVFDPDFRRLTSRKTADCRARLAR